jgi:FtsH-binding integral membrane protein
MIHRIGTQITSYPTPTHISPNRTHTFALNFFKLLLLSLLLSSATAAPLSETHSVTESTTFYPLLFATIFSLSPLFLGCLLATRH